MKNNYHSTMYACFVGYVVQAILNNFAPLLFLTFEKTYHIPLSHITLLVTINFGIQLLVDLLSAGFADKIGYRTSIVLAHILAACGLLSLAVLPDLCSGPFLGLMLAVSIYALGGGFIEVLLSPIMESCPTSNKETAMSLLHSFYCWGHVGVILLSTVFFLLFGVQHWKLLTFVLAWIPIGNGILFCKVPLTPLIGEGETSMRFSELFSHKLFWLLMLMMLCAGASEQAVSQWASTFAETGLGISKTLGDLAGPMTFAILMGCARTFYGRYGEKIHLDSFMIGSGILCIFSYLCISFSSSPVIGLLGCGLCGLSVGIMWPGSFSKASACMKRGGTAMFALLALSGDLGCCLGPTVVGMVSGNIGDNLHYGIFSAIVFPILLVFALLLSQYGNFIRKKRGLV